MKNSHQPVPDKLTVSRMNSTNVNVILAKSIAKDSFIPVMPLMEQA